MVVYGKGFCCVFMEEGKRGNADARRFINQWRRLGLISDSIGLDLVDWH